jgi:hypothetical protein
METGFAVRIMRLSTSAVMAVLQPGRLGGRGIGLERADPRAALPSVAIG